MAAVAPALAPAPTPKDVASARKRRRRAPAGGAADDCFTCARRNVKCDRRRPYCSQCLEIGNECSGYKTQLTWGVGVASRGKLRGLSLPIAKAPPAGGMTKSVALRSPTATKGRASSHGSHGDEKPAQIHIQQAETLTRPLPLPLPTPTPTPTHREAPDEGAARGSRDATPAAVPFTVPRYAQTDGPVQQPPPPRHWTPMALPASYPSASAQAPRFAAAAARGLHLTLPGQGQGQGQGHGHGHGHGHSHSHGHGHSHSHGHGDMLDPAMHDVEYLSPMTPITPISPMSHSYPPRDGVTSFLHSPALHSPALHSPALHSPALHSPALHSPAVMCFGGMVYRPQDMADMQPCRDYLDTYGGAHGPYWAPSSAEEDHVAYANDGVPPSPWPLVSLSSIPSKMAFFTDYYEKAMCPSMVFVDGPANPYREHVLRLAGVSRSLQHAVCALAACNLRMKRRLSLSLSLNLAQSQRDHGDATHDAPGTESDDPSIEEEFHHRDLALHLLDQQLADPARSPHDAVLATMLIMCHYRMAESGVASFHAQFAAVRKRLDMGPRSGSATDPAACVEALLTYVDAISATINEREAQLDTTAHAPLLLLPGIENLVGCDRDLFATISKLGRLNLLSQQRPVRPVLLPRSTSPPDLYNDHLFAAPPSMPMSMPMPPDDLMHAAALHQHPPSPAASTYDDQHQTFWREWHDARAALQAWEFDAARVLAGLPGLSSTTASASAPSPSLSSSSTHVSTPSLTSTSSTMSTCTTSPPSTAGPAPAQVRDLGSVSEAFRYAALLYTERLGSPAVPSAHQTFRTLVSQVVYYATSLAPGSAAEKFLLWPLFVAGSECVNEYQQALLRSKIRDVVARTAYMNNLAALDVLERLWNGEGKDDGRTGGLGLRRGPLHWTRCMGGPGFEAEWILI